MFSFLDVVLGLFVLVNVIIFLIILYFFSDFFKHKKYIQKKKRKLSYITPPNIIKEKEEEETRYNDSPLSWSISSEEDDEDINQKTNLDNIKIDDDKKNIFIIDDSAVIRKKVEMILSNQYNIIGYVDAFDAFNYLNLDKNNTNIEQKINNDDEMIIPDLIIIDNDMPIMTGQEFVASIHKNKKYSEIPVIMISSNKQPLYSGVSVFLRKPFLDETLSATVTFYIESRDRRLHKKKDEAIV